MPTFYDSENKPYTLGEQLGRGGEGAVFACEDVNIVAKIYHAPIEEEKAEKLRWMAQNKDEKLLKVAAWVIDVLRDQPNGKVVGFLMPNVRAKEIHELYSLKSRRVYFPEATWHFLVHTSVNVARAFYSLHKHAHVMGDVNHGNCVVLADGTVKLIDCDSYSIKTDKMRYRCDVGVATHLAPELQKADLGEIEREANHDNFGLAVIIFQLLFLGRHPFAGNYTGAEDKSLEECIAEYRFAYGEKAELYRVKRPPGTLSMSQVSPRVAALFERAFSSENKSRPEPREWIEALEDLSDNLEQCSFHPGHLYFNGLAVCPWCELESKTGVMLFPFFGASKDTDGERQFNIFTVENLIANLGVSTNLPARPPKPEVLPMPSPEIVAVQKTNHQKQYAVVGMHFVLLTILMAIFGVGISCFLGFLLMAIFIAVLNESDKTLRGDINDRLTAAQAEWERLENEWSQYVSPKKLTDELSRIKFKISEYQNLQTASVRQLQSFDKAARKQNFEDYSRTIKIDDAKTLGVEDVHINALKYHGIETAADLIDEKLDSVLPVHKNVKANLLEWRRNLEAGFNFSNKAEISSAERSDFVQKTLFKRRTIERDIETLFASLRSGSLMMRQRQQQIVSQSEKAARELSQAESDLEVVGTNSFAVLALLLITFVMPFIGILLSEASAPRGGNNPPPVYVPNEKTKTSSVRAEPATIEKGPVKNVQDYDAAADNLYVPYEATDKEIASMSAEERAKYADILRRQAVNLKYSETVDYAKAERKLRLALRFDDSGLLVLNELAGTLNEQQKYFEAIKILERSLKLHSYDDSTKIFLAQNYLEVKNYDAARDILIGVTAEDASSFEGYYYLGLAYKGLNSFYAAEGAFREAVRIYPSAESHYELGYAYFKQGKMSEAERQYKELLKFNKTLAARLRKEANF